MEINWRFIKTVVCCRILRLNEIRMDHRQDLCFLVLAIVLAEMQMRGRAPINNRKTSQHNNGTIKKNVPLSMAALFRGFRYTPYVIRLGWGRHWRQGLGCGPVLGNPNKHGGITICLFVPWDYGINNKSILR